MQVQVGEKFMFQIDQLKSLCLCARKKSSQTNLCAPRVFAVKKNFVALCLCERKHSRSETSVPPRLRGIFSLRPCGNKR